MRSESGERTQDAVIEAYRESIDLTLLRERVPRLPGDRPLLSAADDEILIGGNFRIDIEGAAACRR